MSKKNSKINKKKDLNTLNEPQPFYKMEEPATRIVSQDYISIEDFRIEAKKRVFNLLKKNGIHS